MKNLIFLVLIVFGVYHYHIEILSLLGMGKGIYGISDTAPLGTLNKFSKTLEDKGFVQSEEHSKIVFTSSYDEEHDSGFTNVILLSADDDGLVTSITGVFVGSQHGMSPQRPTMTERVMTQIWKFFNSRTKFEEVNDGILQMPYGIRLAQSHKEARFATDEISGLWGYDERMPHEMIKISVN